MTNLPETTRALFRTFGTRGEDRASRLWLEACLAKTHGLAQASALLSRTVSKVSAETSFRVLCLFGWLFLLRLWVEESTCGPGQLEGEKADFSESQEEGVG